jgi:uncharacterized circularly permuted ATP-grasp superfamily protein/uncharacterized alpha-E superfamily protein
VSQNQSQTLTPLSLSYTTTPGLLDDVVDDQGQGLPHWNYLLDSLEKMGPVSFADRQAKALRILRDDGATYNIYEDTASPNRTWGLDLVPSLISSEHWATIESGLVERSELFNLILKDLYGPRDLIRQGVIPPEALFAHQGFLRACDGIQIPGEHELILHATDMMRTADGEMCILTDRTQSPSGAGYALENRTVMSRVLPSLYRDSHVHRLAGFFQQLRQKLYSLSPNQDNPRVVVLTPGSYNETYFEHAYIANYLGLHLVQSGDLVVRNGFVWMKTLEGLNRVDVILRRVDDTYCDPVELRGDSQLGVAGLLNVARAGNVVIANPLGSGVLENPIFLKYLPAIAKQLLGRDLRLNHVASYWCGDPADLAYVCEHIHELVIKPIYRGSGKRSVYGGTLTEIQQQELLQQIKSKPMSFVAQPSLDTSHTPTFVKGKLLPRPAILRTFSVASDTSYSVLPGGLTRVGVDPSAFIISNQVGSQSKDTWVIASEPERDTERFDQGEALAKEADRISLPSRVVENLFWMGRNAERAESSLRILRTVFVQLNGEMPISETARRHLLESVSMVTGTQPGFIGASAELIENPDDELLQVVGDASRIGSVRSNLNAIINCADEAKELLSSDMLRVVNDIRDALLDLDSALSGGLASAPEEALDPLVSALMALSGLSQESMVRDFGWHFMEIGRRLERAHLTTVAIERLLVQDASESDQAVMIETLLLSLESLISYRRRYRARVGVQSSLDLIMMDTSNPRSLLYQIEALKTHVHALPNASDASHELTQKERLLLECETVLKLPMLSELSQRVEGKRVNLSASMIRMKNLLASLNNVITDTYFDHRETSQQLVRRNWENN